jgi:ADP-L-glycero-D-manno-heptose 6-epimerase
MLLVTGGAGFIGSNVVAGLNEAGRTDIVVNDVLGSEGKWRNLAKRQIADFVPPAALMPWLERHAVEAVIHLGAISDTTATDADRVIETNFRFSMQLLNWCTARRVRFIYASSAATYGDGTLGFVDDNAYEALTALRPLNLYGWSKHLFDLAVVDRARRQQNMPPQCAGLKFFNVFGPNEYHKGAMASVVARVFDRAKTGEHVRLFKSHREGIADGDQRRDFIYVDDAVAVVRWLLDTPSVNGIYNVGTGVARSFSALIGAMFAAMNRSPDIVYVDMPPEIRPNYQYFTEAQTDRLRAAGFAAPFTPLEAAVADYVTRYLDSADRYR